MLYCCFLDYTSNIKMYFDVNRQTIKDISTKFSLWVKCNEQCVSTELYIYIYNKIPKRINQVMAWRQPDGRLHERWQWRHNGRDGVSNHQPHDCLLNRLFRRRSKKASKLCVTGPRAGNLPVTGEFPAQMASSAENVSIGWRHHDDDHALCHHNIRPFACLWTRLITDMR